MAIFSNRSNFEHHPNRLSQLIQAAKQNGSIWADLTVSNPTNVGFNYQEAILQSFTNKDALKYKPSSFGIKSAREAVAKSLSRFHPSLDPERIILSASTSEAYSWLFKLLSDGEGNELLAPSPSYPLFDHLARLEGLSIRPYRLAYDGAWYIDSGTLQKTEKTRAILAVSPNNPTGHFLHQTDFEHLESLGLPIICDEVFAPYPLEGKDDPERIDSLLGLMPKNLCFVLGGLSKQVGLPQMKVGWTIVLGPDDLVQEALQRLELIADTFLSVGTPVQCALPQILDLGRSVHDQIQTRIEQNLTKLRSVFDQSLVTVRRCEGGWTAVLELPRIDTEDHFVERFLNHGILVQPGWLYDFEREAFVVLSLLIDPMIFEQAILRMKTLVEEED